MSSPNAANRFILSLGRVRAGALPSPAMATLSIAQLKRTQARKILPRSLAQSSIATCTRDLSHSATVRKHATIRAHCSRKHASTNFCARLILCFDRTGRAFCTMRVAVIKSPLDRSFSSRLKSCNTEICSVNFSTRRKILC